MTLYIDIDWKYFIGERQIYYKSEEINQFWDIFRRN